MGLYMLHMHISPFFLCLQYSGEAHPPRIKRDAANPAPYRTKSLTRETRTKHVPRRGTPTATRASTHTSACGTTHSTTALAAARHLLTLLARGRAARAKSAAIVAVAPTVRVNKGACVAPGAHRLPRRSTANEPLWTSRPHSK